MRPHDKCPDLLYSPQRHSLSHTLDLTRPCEDGMMREGAFFQYHRMMQYHSWIPQGIYISNPRPPIQNVTADDARLPIFVSRAADDGPGCGKRLKRSYPCNLQPLKRETQRRPRFGYFHSHHDAFNNSSYDTLFAAQHSFFTEEPLHTRGQIFYSPKLGIRRTTAEVLVPSLNRRSGNFSTARRQSRNVSTKQNTEFEIPSLGKPHHRHLT